MKIFAKNKLFLSGAVIVGVMIVLAVCAPFITKHDPNSIDLEKALIGPSHEHLFGTDSLGRDLFSRMLFGARISLSVGFVAVGIAVLIGMILGSMAGYYGGGGGRGFSRKIRIILFF